MKTILIFILLTSLAIKASDIPEKPKPFRLDIENALAWQSYNRNQIPNTTLGTKFDLTNFVSGARYAPRLYFSYFFNEKHSLRALIFPFQAEGTGISAEEIKFNGQTFAPGQSLKAKYRFHSYRLSYRYQFFENENWELKVGFTAKIRNANVALSQGEISTNYSNWGFVPLLYFNAKYFLSPNWRLEFDMDALAAPQGRAEDISIQAWHGFNPSWELGLGYRTLEGRADNSRVSTFTWLHFLILSTSLRF